MDIGLPTQAVENYDNGTYLISVHEIGLESIIYPAEHCETL